MIYENLGAFMKRITCFSSFVDSAQSFPKPLTKEEEQMCLTAMKNGDKCAREILITHNLRLVAHIVKKFPNSLEADDLISTGTIGLIKAIDSFDPQKNVRLSTYASRCIENEILMLIRANKRHKDVISLSTICSTDKNDNDLELEQVIQFEESLDVIDKVENSFMLDKVKAVAQKRLSPQEQEVIFQRYGMQDGTFKSQKEVASSMGISRSYISRIETKALETLREELSNSDNG